MLYPLDPMPMNAITITNRVPILDNWKAFIPRLSLTMIISSGIWQDRTADGRQALEPSLSDQNPLPMSPIK